MKFVEMSYIPLSSTLIELEQLPFACKIDYSHMFLWLKIDTIEKTSELMKESFFNER